MIIGFREQAAAVAVGAKALIDRAISERTDMIIEGAHLVPGFLEGVESDEAIIVSLVVIVEDEELHRSHFYHRGVVGTRGQERYLKNFKKIRRIQKYMMSSAMMRGVPTIDHYDLDATLSQIIDHVLNKALSVASRGVSVDKSREKLFEKAVEVIDKKKQKEQTEGSVAT